MYYVYILKSIKFNRFYVGQTQDLEKRIEYHNSSHSKWTKRYQPWKIVYYEECLTRADAMEKEKNFKDVKNIAGLLEKLL
jgi:putative endonuclease